MTPEQVTFNNLPEAIAQLLNENQSLLRDVQKLSDKVSALSGGKEVMDVELAAEFLNKTPAGIYAMVHRREINYYKPDKGLQFLRSDLLDWVMNGKQSAVENEVGIVRRNIVHLNKKLRSITK